MSFFCVIINLDYSTSELFLLYWQLPIFPDTACRALSVGAALQQKKSLPDRTGKNVVLVDGVRTPFLVSFTDYSKMMPHELARHSLL